MSFALTFGGFGDFTTLVGIIVEVCKLIDACYKASNEQKAVINSLIKFKDSLLLWEPILITLTSPKGAQYSQPVLAAGITIHNVITECSHAISDFRDKVTRDVITSDGALGWRRALRAVAGLRHRLHWVWSLKAEAHELQKLLDKQTMLVLTCAMGMNLNMVHSVHCIIASESSTGALRVTGVRKFVGILGEEFSIANYHCSTFEEFDRFLQYHYHRRAGNSWVQRGKYQLAFQTDKSDTETIIDAGTWDLYREQPGRILMAVKMSLERRPQYCFNCAHPIQPSFVKTTECTHCSASLSPISLNDSQHMERQPSNLLQDAAEHPDWRYIRRVAVMISPGLSARLPFVDDMMFGSTDLSGVNLDWFNDDIAAITEEDQRPVAGIQPLPPHPGLLHTFLMPPEYIISKIII